MKLSRKLLILASLSLSNLSTKNAFALATCGTNSIIAVYNVRVAAGGGNPVLYYILAYVKNNSTTKAFGNIVQSIPLSTNPFVTMYQSIPTIVGKQATVPTYVVRSTKPINGVTANGVTNISTSQTAQDLSFASCPAFQESDLIFMAQANRTYTLQKTSDLLNWTDIENVMFTSNNTIWRPQSYMRSIPAPVREFYRAKATCTTPTDCETEKTRLNQSVIDLKNLYR